jgi:gamma-D-glutamyl-L-lysine dipeptidyl-peptidase
VTWTGPRRRTQVDLTAWNRALRTAAARTWLGGPIRTQALYGQQMVVRARSGTWVKVAVVDEPDPRDPQGYPGWLPADQLRPPLEPGDRSVVVLQPRARLHARDRDLTLSYGTRLLLAEQQDDPAVVAVTTPDGPGVIAATAVGASKEPTRASILSDGLRFLGRRYLWGGLSSWGWDCSGLIWNLFRAHGRTIPRDADPLYRVGRPVSLRHLRPADLLFWGTRQHVHHVALYTGDGMMLEAPDSSGRVQVAPVRRTGLVGARRYLDR